MEETIIPWQRYNQSASSAEEWECLVGSSSNRHHDLIASIYDAALDPSLWQHCYDEMRSILRANRRWRRFKTRPWRPPCWRATWTLGFCRSMPRNGGKRADAWAIGGISQPRGRSFIVSDIVPDAVWMRSEIFNELVKPLADCRHCIGTIVDVGGALGVMGFHRPSMASNFIEADRRRLQGLVPHIQRALRIGQQLERERTGRRTALAALDALSFGLIVVDTTARPMLVNRKAESYLQAGDAFLDGHSGDPFARKIFERPMSSNAWCEICFTAFRNGECDDVSASPSRGAVDAADLPARRPSSIAARSLVRNASALIVVLDPDQENPPDHSLLRSLFGMTSAEARIASRLALGERLEEIAVHQRIKLSTVRTHLKSLPAKTDTDRQASLVQLLTRLAINGGDGRCDIDS